MNVHIELTTVLEKVCAKKRQLDGVKSDMKSSDVSQLPKNRLS